MMSSRVRRPRAPKVALIVDNPQRDLAGLVLVALELCQHGVDCYLVPATLREAEIWSLAPDFVLLYHFRRGFTKFIEQLQRAGIAIGALENEGGVWPQVKNYTDTIVADRELRKAARFMCAWGPKLADALVDGEFFTRDQMRVTGAPRFDFYHPAWSSVVLGERANGSESSDQPRILFNTNYSDGNPRFETVEVGIAHLVEVFRIPRAAAEQLMETQRRAVRDSVELARWLARDYPNARIVLRPHPFESPDVYANALGDIPNVELNLDGPVQAQIARAVAVIQRTSTTAVETSIAGVPALSPRWIPTATQMPLVDSVSVPCESYEALRGTVDSILAGDYRTPDDIRCSTELVIREWFHAMDGMAHRRVAEAVVGELGSLTEVDRAYCGRMLHRIDSSPRRSGKRFGRIVRHRLGLSPEWSFRAFRAVPPDEWVRSDQYFDAERTREISARIEAARRIGEQAAPGIRISQARDRNDYSYGYRGYSVALTSKE